MSQRPRLGELLVEAGVIDEVQRQQALEAQRKTGRRFGATLLEMRALDEETLIRTLARQLALPVVWLDGKQIRQEVLDLVPRDLVEKHRCLPAQIDAAGPTLLLAMEDPSDDAAIEEVAAHAGMQVKPVLAAASELAAAIARHAPTDPGDSLACAEFVNVDASGPDLVAVQNRARLAPPTPAIERDPPLETRTGTSQSDLVLRAMTQLLVEKGILSRAELIERLGALRADAQDGDGEG